MKKRFAAVMVFCLLLWGVSAQAQTSLSPGTYQLERDATCRLSQLADGSWQLYLWQGGDPLGPSRGYALLARLVTDTSGTRLTGSWQAMPGSCCPGVGRLEIQVLGPDSFRFMAFSASLQSEQWNILPGQDFKKIGPAGRSDPAYLISGKWRLSIWYPDLLPDGEPADPHTGDLIIQSEDGRLGGKFSAWPSAFKVTPAEDGAFSLEYQDQKAGFGLQARITPEAGGLAYEGSFQSSLGSGRLSLVRAGLPADPASQAKTVLGSISGTYVDPRTGNDFFRLKGSESGFEFTAYGGSYELPRYLSRGYANPSGQGRYLGRAQDEKGYCCGNQGRLIFREVGPDTLEVSAFWWPQGQTDPGNLATQPYQIQRVRQKAEQASAGTEGQGWPLISPPQGGLLAADQGALRVRFSFNPPPKTKERSLFSQDGYMSGLDLYLDSQNRLAAQLRGPDGPIVLRSRSALTPMQTHEAWLVYRSGSQAVLWLDGQEQAKAQLGRDWRPCNAPLMIGGSRWPGRVFGGSIELLELWRDPPRMDKPGAADFSLRPSAPSKVETAVKSSEPEAERELMAFWHPGKLARAYASDASGANMLKAQGYEAKGPVGRLLTKPGPDRLPLYAHREDKTGRYILLSSQKSPQGYTGVGLLGYLLARSASQATELVMLRADLPDPLREGSLRDYYYTSSQDNQTLAQEAGYSKPKLLGYLLPVKEANFELPVLYNWEGSWRGEGWGKFHLLRRKNVLYMFWYYGAFEGPHYFGRYQLDPDGLKATGYAVGRPGDKATYYRQNLTFNPESPTGPSITIQAYRLAAPLDDGRLLTFAKPQYTQPVLYKTSQALPAREAAVLQRRMIEDGFDPEAELQKAIAQAREEGRLLER